MDYPVMAVSNSMTNHYTTAVAAITTLLHYYTIVGCCLVDHFPVFKSEKEIGGGKNWNGKENIED